MITSLSSCKYKPFIKYFFQNKKTNLPSFHKKDYLAGSKNEWRTSFDLLSYDWYVKPDSEKKDIEGLMKIGFKAKSKMPVILLDMHRALKIDRISSSSVIEKYKHKADLLFIYFEQDFQPGKDYEISIQYHGKPVIIQKEGPIQWRKDSKGKDWISTLTQGLGAHYMMPCKLPLYDEPEECIIRVETDKDLVVVANGSLDSITEKSNSHIYHHSVQNPINIYSISFNIGDFVRIDKKYRDIKGIERTVQVFSLANFKDTADVFYDDLPLYLKHLEELLGPFPWWDDGCKIVQSTLGGVAMEHQSAISMGSIFYYDFTPPNKKHINTTVIHELSHEWWGNMISADDYSDVWIHEGMATYIELLAIERIYEKAYYTWSANRLKYYVDNHRPVIKTRDVLYSSWINPKDYNIYSKGALCLHTLRQQLDNDSLFLNTLRKATDHFAFKNISSKQLEAYFNEQLGRNFDWLFDMYLRNTEVPKIVYAYDSLKSSLDYKWSGYVKDQEKLNISVRNSGDQLIPVIPEQHLKNLKIKKGEKDLFDVGMNGYIIFEELEKEELLKLAKK